MKDANESTFADLAGTLCELLSIDAADEGPRIVVAQAMKQAYTAGVLAGVELAEAGIAFAAQVDAEAEREPKGGPLAQALVEAVLEGAVQR